MRTLIFPSILFFQDNYLSIEQSETFRRVSRTNIITHIIYNDVCTLEKVKLLVALCPRIQNLSICTGHELEKPIIRFLLNRSNSNTRHLCFLCIRECQILCSIMLEHLITSESLLDDYILNETDSKLCLWWQYHCFHK